uniref:RRM domain-containing protein n=1 Tax=Quercus lobata TaxID=97700 RepID=A0A7N2LHD3_QUELO
MVMAFPLDDSGATSSSSSSSSSPFLLPVSDQLGFSISFHRVATRTISPSMALSVNCLNSVEVCLICQLKLIETPCDHLCILNYNTRIQYAKTKSDCIAKEDGSYDKKKKQEEKAERKRCAEEAQQSTMPNGASAQNGGSTASFRHGNSSAQEAVAPNNILFIENLPHEATSMMLEMLFQQHPGFREVRMIVVKPGIAFVEFEDDQQSSMAMQTLQGFKITPQNPMTITFAKK